MFIFYKYSFMRLKKLLFTGKKPRLQCQKSLLGKLTSRYIMKTGLHKMLCLKEVLREIFKKGIILASAMSARNGGGLDRGTLLNVPTSSKII